MNVLEGLAGEDLFLYDTECYEKNTVNSKAYYKRKLRYKFKIIKGQQAASIIENQIKEDMGKVFKVWKQKQKRKPKRGH